jgi:hypothetical protein
MSNFYNANYLEAKKLLPILEEVKRRMIPEKKAT